MRPYPFLPFLKEALEKAFEDDPFVDIYATSSYLVAKAGGHRLKVVVKGAPGGVFSGHLLVHLLSRKSIYGLLPGLLPWVLTWVLTGSTPCGSIEVWGWRASAGPARALRRKPHNGQH